MKRMRWPQRLFVLLRGEIAQLTTLKPHRRPWQMPLAAALAIGLPLLCGVFVGRLDLGLIASLGGLVFLYLPETPLAHRMVTIMACAFGMVACYALGAASHLVPMLLVPLLTIVAILVTMVCRVYRIGPPGSLFFIMVAAIGAYTPLQLADFPQAVGLFALGALGACLIAFFYSLIMLRTRAPRRVEPLPRPTFDFVVFDAVLIGLAVGASLALAQLLQLEKPYWAPVSCLAVVQAASLREVWTKQLHRILGTVLGLMMAGGVLLLPLGPWGVAWVMMVLAFVIEVLVVRHYGLAVVFITPLAILLAEAAAFGQLPVGELIQARFVDTVLGCAVGLGAGACLHNERVRTSLGGWMLRMLRRAGG